MTAVREVLVVLDAERAAQARSAVGAHAHIVQELLPRLLVCHCDESSLAAVRAVAGVVAVCVDEVPQRIAATASDEERLFIDAWKLRRVPKGPRVGDGLDWDAPGFVPPPDAPPA